MIIVGTSMFGQVDEVPETGYYVATEFAHAYFFPLFPIRGWIVTGKTATGWQGKQIPIDGKSFLAAWTRAALVLGAGAAAIAGCTLGGFALVALGGLAVGLGAASWASYHTGPFGPADAAARARIERELELAPGTLAAAASPAESPPAAPVAPPVRNRY